MRAIIIGAGRGSRLMPTTADLPKCFAEVAQRPILDWILDAFRANGVERICFIGGYQMEKVRQRHSEFTFRHNTEWESNNILASLFYAEDLMDEPFICCYSDILFTKRTIETLITDESDISLVIDTSWRERYEHRSQHPTHDAEKVTARNGRVTRIHREIHEQEAYGEYIGVAKFSKGGAGLLREHYHRSRRETAGGPFREAASFKKAYLIHLFQEMIESGVEMSHADTPGGYIEIDTQEGVDYARQHWVSKHQDR
jgi:choline kinase